MIDYLNFFSIFIEKEKKVKEGEMNIMMTTAIEKSNTYMKRKKAQQHTFSLMNLKQKLKTVI